MLSFAERTECADLIKAMLIWAPPGLQELVCVKIQEAGLQSYIRPVVQADIPAGPDGFR